MYPSLSPNNHLWRTVQRTVCISLALHVSPHPLCYTKNNIAQGLSHVPVTWFHPWVEGSFPTVTQKRHKRLRFLHLHWEICSVPPPHASAHENLHGCRIARQQRPRFVFLHGTRWIINLLFHLFSPSVSYMLPSPSTLYLLMHFA